MTSSSGHSSPRPRDRTSELPDSAAIEKLHGRTDTRPPLLLEPMGAPYRRASRPAYGSNPDAWEAEFGQQGVVILAPRREEVGRAVAQTAAAALREGVRVSDITVLPPATVTGAGRDQSEPSRMAAQLLDRGHERRALEQRIQALDREAENARRSSRESTEESNRSRYRKEADRAARAARTLREELDRTTVTSKPSLPLPALARVHPVLFALMQVADPARSTDLAATYAVQQVIRDLALVPDELMIQGSFSLAVPTTSRQLILGPMTFRLPNHCRNGVAVYLQQADFTERTMAPAFRSRAERQELVDRLQKGPSALSPSAAGTAVQSYFAAIPKLLLNEETDERAGAWHDPHWKRWVSQAYMRLPSSRNPAPWFQVSPFRQAFSYAIADARRPLTRPEVLEVMRAFGITKPHERTHQVTADSRSAEERTSSSWSWPAAAVREGRGSTWRCWLRECPRCGGPSELVVRTPELPFGCMCPCGGAPGLPPDVVVPSGFRHLVIPRGWIPEYAASLAA